MTILSKKPHLKDTLSLAVPEKAPPTVIPGNSGTTGGSSPCVSVAFIRWPIDTLGSTIGVFVYRLTSRTYAKLRVNICFLRLATG